ncbi:DUF535 family protein [Campylobacter canadensis]|uniref:DUF535 family protein n=1 Tax=Campylobacter canadensis TaxID=449520 RepID=A0ABS7WRG4_9BACT|nr:DUF535 family protein [Campylobacter canadensis]MBZ7986544.1 DUF535 family protein [Campylobacter canadensis]MBZ7997580.1 DUF535 family protein [Campylobacter canadensis]
MNLKATRLFLRKIIYFNRLKLIKEFLSAYPDIEKFFYKDNKYLNDMLCKKYACNSFSFSFYFSCFKRDINILFNKYPNILKSRSECIFRQDSIALYLNMYPRVISEGFFQLVLFYKENCLYTLSFTLLEEALFISALQGATNNKELLKEFTKDFHSIRPMNFIIFMAFVFAKSLSLKQVYAVKDKYMVSNFKRNRIRNNKIVYIQNYDDIWKDNTKIIKENKESFLIEYLKKDLEEIPSKKRSMYKKRYEFLDSIRIDNES